MENVFDTLKSRGFIEHVTDEQGVRKLFSSPVTCYIGFDPTASTLHVGSLVPIMAVKLKHGRYLQKIRLKKILYQ